MVRFKRVAIDLDLLAHGLHIEFSWKQASGAEVDHILGSSEQFLDPS